MPNYVQMLKSETKEFILKVIPFKIACMRAFDICLFLLELRKWSEWAETDRNVLEETF